MTLGLVHLNIPDNCHFSHSRNLRPRHFTLESEYIREKMSHDQGGITFGAIEDPRKSSKAIDERVIINFRDKNVVIAHFRDKNVYR